MPRSPRAAHARGLRLRSPAAGPLTSGLTEDRLAAAGLAGAATSAVQRARLTLHRARHRRAVGLLRRRHAAVRMTAGRRHAVGVDRAIVRRACIGRGGRLRLRLRRGGRLLALLGPAAREQREETEGTNRNSGTHGPVYVPGPRELQAPRRADHPLDAQIRPRPPPEGAPPPDDHGFAPVRQCIDASAAPPPLLDRGDRQVPGNRPGTRTSPEPRTRAARKPLTP